MTPGKICVLGSSYVGAVYSAYRSAVTPVGFELDFYGHSNGGFPSVDVVDGRIRNTRFRSPGGDGLVSDYRAFVVYGDLPSPHDLSKIMGGCIRDGLSEQVTQALVADVITGKAAYRIAGKLRASTGRPVFLVSANVVSISKAKLNAVSYAGAVALIEDVLGEGVYIEFPGSLFDERYRPRPEFYKDSILLTGDKAGETPGHDYHHMNEAGGAEVLRAIFDRLERELPTESRAVQPPAYSSSNA